MDAFYAAIEGLRHPELKGKPLVVGGSDPQKRGVVATASYEARKYGIHSAMPLRTAYQRCPHAVFLPADFRLYRSVSRRIKDILREVTPRYESAGLDEAYLDVSEVDGSSESIATGIQSRILAETRLTCSIGIAPTKLLAKIASDMKKPAGVTILQRDDVERRVWPLPVRKLIGVGPRTEERLAAMGVKTIGDLAALPVETLARAMGPSHARYLNEAARGLRDSPVVTERPLKSISRETTFQDDLTARERMIEVLDRLTTPVVADLDRHQHQARTVSVKLRFADFTTLSRQATLAHPSARREDIWPAVLACFERFDLDRPVRLLGVGVKGLDDASTPIPKSQEELDLWS